MPTLKYWDGKNWIPVSSDAGGGATVGFTESVGVDTTDCDIGPADSTGKLAPDGPEVDGVQPYKLALTLPRPPVVTTSETEPVDACDGDFWADNSEAEILPPDKYRTLWGTWAGDFGTGSATDENGKLKSEGISSVVYISTGCYDIFFDEPFQDNKYCWVGQAGTVSLSTPTPTVAGLRTGVIAPEKLRVFSNFINITNNELFNYESLSVIIFNRID